MSVPGSKQIIPNREEVVRIIKGHCEGEYEKLRGVPTFVLDPISWEDARAHVQDNTEESLERLGRHPAQVATYWDFRDKVQAQYGSMAELAKIRMLGYASAPGPDGRLVAMEAPQGPDGGPHIVWRPNDFPYNLAHGIEHHNVWATQPLSTERLKEVIRRQRQGWEWVYFINPLSISSIPGVWHAHILSRQLQ